MTFSNLLQILPESQIISAKNPEIVLKNLSTDSREGFFLENTLFFALIGERRNGHDFIQEVIQKGGRNFVISENINIENLLQNHQQNDKNIDLNIIKVANTLHALQRIAQAHRQQFEYPVVAITGSNGKTIIKEWLAEILQNLAMNVVKSPKSYNSQIGVPLSVWQMSPLYDVGVFEAGISQMNEMQYLEKILQPNYCIFSNIGEAHENGFSSHLQKIKQKLHLAQNAQKLIFNIKYAQINQVVKKLEKENFFENPEFQKIIWGKGEILDDYLAKRNTIIPDNSKYYRVYYKFDAKKKTSAILIHYFNPNGNPNLSNTYLFPVPFDDEASLENISHILVFLLDFSLEKMSESYTKAQKENKQETSTFYYEKHQNILKNINESVKNLQPVQMRLQRKAGINYCTLIDDTYNNDLEGLKIALDFTKNQQKSILQTDFIPKNDNPLPPKNSRKILILSETPLNQHYPTELYLELLVGYMRQYEVNMLVGIGDFFVENKNLMLQAIEDNRPNHLKLENYVFLKETSDFFKTFSQKDFFQDIILIKGARKYQFEQIVNFLQEKTHRTTLEINLNALTHNLNFYKSLIKPHTKIMVMVKAFAYGTGRTEVAQLLQHQGVDYLAVAYTDEAIALRNEGIYLPIMVMNPTEEDFPQMISHNVEPEIYSFSLLEKWFFYCENIKKQDFAFHLKLDTGMKRLGFETEEIPALADFLEKNLPKNAQLKSIFSHLAGADDSNHNDFSQQQINIFAKNANFLKNYLQKINNYPPLLHILNSAGIVRFPEAHFDMVRLGIGLYGVETNEIFSDKILPIATLKSYISQIKQLKKGESVGYSRTHFAEKNTQIATIAIGYADGLNRLLSNENGEIWVKDRLCKIVGRICMDMCMVDIGDLVVEEGEEVEIFGKNISIQSIAKKINTIPYEILTSVGERVKRVFFSE